MACRCGTAGGHPAVLRRCVSETPLCFWRRCGWLASATALSLYGCVSLTYVTLRVFSVSSSLCLRPPLLLSFSLSLRLFPARAPAPSASVSPSASLLLALPLPLPPSASRVCSRARWRRCRWGRWRCRPWGGILGTILRVDCGEGRESVSFDCMAVCSGVLCVRRPTCGWGQAAERGRLLTHAQCAVRGCWGPPPMRAASDW